MIDTTDPSAKLPADLRIKLPQLLILIIASTGMMSCASIQSFGEKTASLGKKLTPNVSDSKLVGMFTRERPKIVTVRENDLKRLPTGEQLAQSHHRRSRYEIKGGPIDFKQSSTPDNDFQMDGSLLPPR